MVPKLTGELRPPPPPPGAELRLAEPWELYSATASTKKGSMAADVRRWGALGARLNPKGVPAKLFHCSRLYGRNKKSSKFVYPPTKPTRT